MVNLLRRDVVNFSRRGLVSLNRRRVVNFTDVCNEDGQLVSLSGIIDFNIPWVHPAVPVF